MGRSCVLLDTVTIRRVLIQRMFLALGFERLVFFGNPSFAMDYLMQSSVKGDVLLVDEALWETVRQDPKWESQRDKAWTAVMVTVLPLEPWHPHAFFFPLLKPFTEGGVSHMVRCFLESKR